MKTRITAVKRNLLAADRKIDDPLLKGYHKADVPIEQANLPRGKWAGVWGGYTVTVGIHSKCYELVTEVGIVSFNIPCVVIVEEDGVFVEVA